MSQVEADHQQQIVKPSSATTVHKHFHFINAPLIRKKGSSSSVFLPKIFRSSNDSSGEKTQEKKQKRDNLFRSKSKPNKLNKTKDEPMQILQIPSCDYMLDLTNLDDGPEFQKKILYLVNTLLGWDDIVHESQIHLESISGALTNRVFFLTAFPKHSHFSVTQKKPRKVVLRVYGIAVDQLVDRKQELEFLQKLSTLKIGPLLLGIFGNGRFEQYLDSETLTREDIRDLKTSSHIAQRMAILHNIVKLFPPPKDTVPQVWVNIDKWYPLAVKVISGPEFRNDPARSKRLDSFDMERLYFEIQTLKQKLDSLNSPLVFAHNDTQYGNILRLNDGSNELVVVDFEYAGYNFRGFDIANHFCEWSFDYHSPEPHILHSDWYPSRKEQLNFLSSYMGASHDGGVDEHNLELLRQECEAFALASHVMWGLWGLVQAAHSQIKFSYFEYGMLRLEQFRRDMNMNQ
ncbi:5606_t:CDS:2 [Ambispora leptoticha]|uniref:5606_t:CDS:1 n=1 Tax=Ambispora leptoticha TaxID=144679 RepID=A0A9N9F9U5_9GLOM|nr:5606_t:CDS:2 [Ambispora leptoticha]